MTATHTLIATEFWVCTAVVIFTYAGYPILIYLMSRWFGRWQNSPVVATEELPHLSLLIVAHNEEAVIEERIRNALASDYPSDKLEIVVACDGCSDATPMIVSQYTRRNVRLIQFPMRSGKAGTINAAMPQLRGEIVVLSDANTQIDPSAIRHLARWFANPAVGAVCGRLLLTDGKSGRNADSVYWRYETFLKRCEGRLGALLGANGAIYAIRRELFVPIPQRTIIDDFVIPLIAKIKSGCDIIYDCDAVAKEETAPTIGTEFYRRARIGAGGFQAIGMLWRLLDPRRGWVALAFFSHKILRWCCPFFMLGALICSAILWRHPVYAAALLGQTCFYSVSLTGALWPVRRRVPRGVRIAQMFTGMNAALFVGFWRWLGGTQKATWEPTQRPVAYRQAA